jgi:hypothetical protein
MKEHPDGLQEGRRAGSVTGYADEYDRTYRARVATVYGRHRRKKAAATTAASSAMPAPSKQKKAPEQQPRRKGPKSQGAG